ncbi:hypothetical protein PSRA_0500 [Pseudoscardovia radai]|uniref:Uncharacterized protein n=1 Tax=Pseudoscardovia radai TaxID=987066 RepID=A0A261EZN0_9BIFI|nr:hypothetical protein PSRA_0500 [Pseudoscardovia radai]
MGGRACAPSARSARAFGPCVRPACPVREPAASSKPVPLLPILQQWYGFRTSSTILGSKIVDFVRKPYQCSGGGDRLALCPVLLPACRTVPLTGTGATSETDRCGRSLVFSTPPWLTVPFTGTVSTSEGHCCRSEWAFSTISPLTVPLTGTVATSETDRCGKSPVFPVRTSPTVGLIGTGLTSEGHCCGRGLVFSTPVWLTVPLSGTGATSERDRW